MGENQTTQEKQVEDIKERMENLERAYSRVFDRNNPDAQIVLEDLRTCCFVDASTYGRGMSQTDMNINEGCRRVFLRIAQKIRMDFTDLYSKLPQGTTPIF